MDLWSVLFLVGCAVGVGIAFTILRALPWGKDWRATWP